MSREGVKKPDYVILGRSRDCDVIVQDASVSGRHTRLSWSGDRLLVEDLGSANGTWVRGERVERSVVRPGDDVRLGRAPLPWGDPLLRPFLRSGARGDTVVGMPIPGRRFICGACGGRGLMPPGFKEGELRCGACGARLTVGRRVGAGVGAAVAALVSVALAVVVVAWAWPGQAPDALMRRAAQQIGLPDDPLGAALASSPQEAAIRTRIAGRIVQAIDSSSPTTRNTAARIAAGEQGPYHAEQVARIWSFVRTKWRYVNDPRGDEYFAKASETISNGYVGDCDDFATSLAAMIVAIGGEARVVMMDGPRGGHAYAEACIQDDPAAVATKLATFYRARHDDTVSPERLRAIAFRTSPECPVWLNLDWNARVPGGDYEQESWAVSIYPNGRTETLAPAGAPANANAANGAGHAGRPDELRSTGAAVGAATAPSPSTSPPAAPASAPR